MSSLIGRHVKWKHKDQHGKPSLELKGEVVGVVQPLNTTFVNLLVLKTDGSFAVAQHTDVEIDDAGAGAALEFHIDRQLALAATIEELGLATDAMKGDPVGFAITLLRDFMKELREVNDKALTLESELNKLKKKSKKTEDKPEGGA